MNTDRHSPMPVRRIKRGPPCSCCGGREEDIGCCCGEYFCVNCIDAHFDEDDPDFYSAIHLSDPNRPVDLRVEGSIDWGSGNNGARVDAPRLPSGLPRSGTDIESQPLWADSKEGGQEMRHAPWSRSNAWSLSYSLWNRNDCEAHAAHLPQRVRVQIMIFD